MPAESRYWCAIGRHGFNTDPHSLRTGEDVCAAHCPTCKANRRAARVDQPATKHTTRTTEARP
jgi:hypothetical protein